MGKLRIFGGIVTLIVAIIANGSNSYAEPLQKICPSNSSLSVHLVGEKADLFEIWDRSRIVMMDYVASRDAMGGNSIECKDILIRKDTVAVRLGEYDDILHAFYIYRDKYGETESIQYLAWSIRDGTLQLDIDANQDILVTAGRESDIHYRLCPNWNGVHNVWGKWGGRVKDFPLCDVPLPKGWEALKANGNLAYLTKIPAMR